MTDFPQNWQIASDFDPNEHLLNLKGKDYLNVQNRLIWFIRDQRAFIASGLAQMPYVVRTELVEMDREKGFAHFKSYVRDVLGNECTAYGSETARDFGDFAEKAGTKSLGRALLGLGYGTAFAPEMDEGERVADAPVESKRRSAPVAQPTRAQVKPEPDLDFIVDEPPAEPEELNLDTSTAAEREYVHEAASSAEMTRQQFIAALGEMKLSPKAAMDRLGLKTLENLNYREALATLKHPLAKKASSKTTPAAAATAEMGGKRLGVTQQRELARTMATAGFHTIAQQEVWLRQALGRDIEISELTKGVSDVTFDELSHVLSELERTAAARRSA